MSFTKFIKGVDGFSDEEKSKLMYTYINGEEVYKQRVKEIREAKLRSKKINKEMYNHAAELLFDDANNNLTISTIKDMIQERMKKGKTL